MFPNHSTPAESEEPHPLVFCIFATEADFHQVRPELRHLPYTAFLRNAANLVASAQWRGDPIVIKELRAGHYHAWLDRHGLEESIPNCSIYGGFAPVMDNQSLLTKLGADCKQTGHLSRLHSFTDTPDPALVNQVEDLAVSLAVAHQYHRPLSILRLVFAMAHLADDQKTATAVWALADQIATGLPQKGVEKALADSVALAAVL